VVRLACHRCGRVGQHRKDSLLSQYGRDVALPDLRHDIAKCEWRGKISDGCGVHYVGVA